MIGFPNAKINIGLQVLSRRDDGYHNICSVLYPIGLKDALELIPNQDKQDSVFSSSGIPVPGDSSSNLCLKAVDLIRYDYPVPGLRIHLHKHIPIGAGLGGGSSDGAGMIKLLNDCCELGLSWGEMHHYARQLGSDCSFFIANKPAIVTGRGDETESINLTLRGYYLVLVYPAVHISTKEAYAMVTPEPVEFDLEKFLLNHSPGEWKDLVKNDFEPAILKKYPEIERIKKALYASGALYASMSGSGSSVFGIFQKQTSIREQFPECFVWEEELK
jgi:4-diphosphocytidyl-2-C-methyl-D-erythritol kinase